MSTMLKIIFAGTSEFAAVHLSGILESDYRIISVLTQPDRPAGRGYKLTASPVKMIAQSKNIPVMQPESLCSKNLNIKISNLCPDIIIVVAYGLIIPRNIIKIPRLGCINVHASILPRWRGAAPVQRAILAGDTKTGITIIQMDETLDTGDILYQVECDIKSSDTYLTLHERLSKLGTYALINILLKISSGKQNISKKQDNKSANYAKKIKKKDAKIDWQCTAEQLERCVRAFNPWPGSFFYIDNNKLIKVWQVSVLNNDKLVDIKPGVIIKVTNNGIQVATAKGIINLMILQPAGKKPMLARYLINSRYEWFKPGTKLN
ncbi:methionyl-tRNA formyltransferase [Candidatus Pantoea edessiphila]|uniref:Methionyl-tRNA formyltransferase n=1 Tax=Candidatus Pantoea edessiphila TaxID=2044610 RepID=A0A2P5SY22_9GAMM|nr:methionyl-tRNA formyltransferase [Candidatus Pantoea edessiphila]MBK4775907.1 methionyl-tRNA formyltransferase [Pantoea sp. Edef]PPI87200.1 methionyl-tRNA formyltransferase [Candidatus Pantoea edessiphila]